MSFGTTQQRLITRMGAAALSSVFALSSAILPAQKPASPSPLAKAKTILVKETFTLLGPDGKSTPYFSVVVHIRRPDSYRLEATPLVKRQGKQAPTSILLVNAADQYEFNGFSNRYTRSKAPKPGERSSSQLYTMAGLAALLHPGAPPAERITRTVGSETLDGKEMIVTTDSEPSRKGKDGVVYTPFVRLWTDAKTGLPYRKADGLLAGDKPQIQLQLDFNEISLNKPISNTQFAWVAPEGATEYVPPTLLAAGAPAPDFEAITPDGKSVHLSDYKGKIVVLDFWATWCGPCQQSLPHLEKVYQQIKEKGVTVLAVCVWDQKAEYDKWVTARKTTFSFQTAFDPAGRGDKSIAGSLYGVSGIPTQYVIDKDGKVASSTVGYEEGIYPLETALAKLGVDIKVPAAKTAAAK